MTSPNTLAAAIDQAILYRLMNIHTAFPARVVSYDYTTRKANLQPVIDKKCRDGTVQPMPQLNNVPVIMPQFINLPVNPGDTCLVVCCERAIDLWLQSGNQGPPNDPRKLDLSDAVAIMGLFPFTETNQASNNTDVVMSFSGSSITIKSNGDVLIKTGNKVAIGTSVTEVLDILSQTLNLLATSVSTAPGTPFAFAANWLALKTQLDLIKGTIT